MRGKVLSFNGSTGLISGDDGHRYAFSVSDLMGDTLFVAAGSTVDFEVALDKASSIYVISAAMGEKNKWIAIILCFLFGCFGIHKFYLGKTNAGVIMLVGSILVIGLPFTMFVSFIELIIYLVKSDQSFYEDYVAGDKSWF
ncbi:MAG: TM2 domain-containing protein [Asticcacaulis sp.]